MGGEKSSVLAVINRVFIKETCLLLWRPRSDVAMERSILSACKPSTLCLHQHVQSVPGRAWLPHLHNLCQKRQKLPKNRQRKDSQAAGDGWGSAKQRTETSLCYLNKKRKEEMSHSGLYIQSNVKCVIVCSGVKKNKGAVILNYNLQFILQYNLHDCLKVQLSTSSRWLLSFLLMMWSVIRPDPRSLSKPWQGKHSQCFVLKFHRCVTVHPLCQSMFPGKIRYFLSPNDCRGQVKTPTFLAYPQSCSPPALQQNVLSSHPQILDDLFIHKWMLLCNLTN